MNATLPNIVKAAEVLLVQMVEATDDFPKKRRTLAGNLVDDATNAVLLGQEASRASKERRRQVSLLRELSRTIDRIKVRLQLAYKLQCLSFARLEMLSVLTRTCGKQCGGWLNQATGNKHPKGQNPAASGRRERAETLSTGAAQQSGAYQ